MSLIDNKDSWYVWDAGGRPDKTDGTDLSSPITIDALTYYYCSGGSQQSVTVTLKLVNVQFSVIIVDGNIHDIWTQKVEASISSSINEDLNITLGKGHREDINVINPSDPWISNGNINLTISSGDTTIETTTLDFEEFIEDDGFLATQDTIYLFGGSQVICTPSPPSCNLEITGTTITPETTTGANDGSIEVFVSGSTGTTMYSLDGGAQQVSNTFSGLGTGTYSVQIFEGDCNDEVTGLFVAEGEFRSGNFIATEPASIVASENPIVTTLRSGFRETPAFAVTDFVIGAGIVDGSSIVFDLVEPIAYTATFTSKDFPNKGNYFVSPTLRDRGGNAIGVNSTAEIAVGLGESLSKDINISRYYFIDVDTSTVTLTAKEQTARMTLDTSNVTVGTGIVMNTITNGVDEYDGSFISDYSLYTDIYVGDETIEFGETLSAQNYDNWSSLELPYAIDNTHKFDIQEIMKTFVFTPKIDLTFTGFTVISNIMRPFFVKYGEIYPLVKNENTKKKREKGETGFKWAMNGAIDFEDTNDITSYAGDEFVGIYDNVPFLTNSPNPLQIQRDSTQYLYFMIVKDYGKQLDVRGDIVFYDGTELLNQTFFVIATGTTNIGGVYCLNVSYDSLGLAAYEASGNTKIKRVTFAVWQDNGTQTFSQEKTYRFEIDEQPRKFGVSFLNKKGTYDIFDFVGVVEDSILRKNKTYAIPREINTDGSSPVGFKSSAMFDTTVIKTVTVNSGWIDETHFDWLIELMNTNDIYSYTEVNQNYLKVKSFKYKKSSLDDLFELEVVFEHTIIINNVTV